MPQVICNMIECKHNNETVCSKMFISIGERNGIAKCLHYIHKEQVCIDGKKWSDET